MPKQARLTNIKAFQSYTIEEAAEVSGVSTRTIRSWGTKGLRVMDDARPALIRGDDLRDYIKSQRNDRAVKTQIDTFYCMSCQGERRAAEGIADCNIAGGRARLTALCETCETLMFKPVAVASVPDIAGRLDLKITRH